MVKLDRFLLLARVAVTVVISAQLAATSSSPPVLEEISTTPFELLDSGADKPAVDSERSDSVEARRLNTNGGPSRSCASVGTALVDQALAQEDLLNDHSGLAETRVSNFAKPIFYTLRLKADPTKKKFTGQLMIKLNINGTSVEKPSNEQPATDAEGYRYLTLHAGSNLQINKAFFVHNTRGGLQVPASRLGRRDDLITLDFYPNVITPGQGLLLIVYAGQVNETYSQGLFVHYSRNPKSFDTQETPADLAGLATHMQPNFARRLLPCWDEPQYKAYFNLIAVLPFRGYEAISNTPIKKKSISVNCAGEPTQEIEFQTTPSMSSYLLTLVVGHYEHLEAFSNSNCRVRVFVYANLTQTNEKFNRVTLHHSKVNSRRAQAKLPLSLAVSALNYLEELFNVKYPLPKLDLIGIRNFQGGGMENWGSVIFHENYLLYDNTSAGITDLQLNGGRTRSKLEAIPLVVAHELAHQWFGNLVTASDWRYLWLNEGFAQFLMYELAQHMYPDRNYWEQFIEDIRASALEEDELLATSHSLEPSDGPTNADESLNIFDQITYNKGAVIVQMLKTFLGRDLFYAGLRSYLATNAFSSVKPQKLWRAFEEVGRLPELRLDNLMGIWCIREGYPLLTVEAFDEGLNWSLRIRQERFTLIRLTGGGTLSEAYSIELPKSTPTNSTQRPWVIPVSVASERHPRPEARHIRLDVKEKQSTTFTFLLEETSSIINLPRASIGSWLKLNFNATGFYRVNYKVDVSPDGTTSAPPVGSSGSGVSVDLMHAMTLPIRSKRLSRLDRFNLADDLFALARSGRKPTAYYLQYLSRAYSEETDFLVLRSIVSSLKSLEVLVSNSEQLVGVFQSWVQRYLRSVKQALRQNRDNIANNHKQFRETEDLIEASEAHFNEPHSLARASELFRRSFKTTRMSPEGPFERELRASIYSAALESERANSRRATIGDLVNSASSLVFQRLLGGYESKISSTERYAISWALGSVRDPFSQTQLLNLTVYDLYFRTSDAHTLLDSLARSRSGRELIWSQLTSQHRHLQEKSMLAPALKALISGGLVERPNTISQTPIESHLRSLYELYSSEHGRLLSQSIELLLINSQWLARDQDGLLAYLTDLLAAPV